MSREFKFRILVLIFKKTFQLFRLKLSKILERQGRGEKKINRKGESASEQIVPKEIFLTECKVNSKICTWKLREKTTNAKL